MPAPAAKKNLRKLPRKRAGKRSTHKAGKRSLAEGMRPFFGMIKNAPADLSMREGFGDQVSH